MKTGEYKNKWWAKLFAAILLFMAGFGFIAGVIGIYACSKYNVYSQSKEEAQLNLNRRMLDKYSVLAMADYVGAADRELSPNYHYAIYEGSGTEGKAVAGDLTQSLTENAVIHEFTVTDSTVYKLADSMYQNAYVKDSSAQNGIVDEIRQLCYSVNKDETIAYDAGGESQISLYVTGQIERTDFDLEEPEESRVSLYVTGQESDGRVLYPVDPKLYRFDEKKGMIWLNRESGVELGLPVSKMQKIDSGSPELAISPYKVSSFTMYDHAGGRLEGNCSFFAQAEAEEGKVYTVAGTVAEELSLTGSWDDADFFEQAQILLGFLYSIRYVAVVLCLVCLILGLVLFIFLMKAAGHRGGPIRDDGISDIRNGAYHAVAGSGIRNGMCHPAADSDIRLLTVDLIPLDLALVIMMMFCLKCAESARSAWHLWLEPAESFFMLGGYVAAAYVPAITFCMILAANVKAGGWWEGTLICRIRKLAGRFFGWICRTFRDLFGKFKKSVSEVGMGKRVWALFAFLVICEFIGLVVLRNYPRRQMACFLIEKVIFFFGLLKILLDFGQIKRVSREIAGGNLECKVGTDKMLTDFADVGNSLNAIGDGLAGAVEERMKSERMKTELITNVSHDIKTPLTSIINYTDLLTRLELEDPTAREYLEVLGRQSARLKKLIEDLIEASKASSGVLKLEIETVNVSMLLMQAVGEYGEKFSQKGLDLRVTGEESDLKVRADSRYLWRVFDNLMSNMLKYAQAGTRAYIDLTSEGDSVCVIFRNISETPLHISGEELMERFVRGDSARATEGSGLGLSIADSLVTLMGGTMEIVVDGDLFKAIVRLKTDSQELPQNNAAI